jgi:hypothetical protein
LVPTWNEKAGCVAVRRAMLDEQTRKMKLAKSVKWQFIRMKKSQMLQE